jgi:hypothetical protein
LPEDKVKEAKKEGKMERQVEKTITQVQKGSSYGKFYEALVNEQQRLDEFVKLKVPLRFSDTCSFARVLKLQV